MASNVEDARAQERAAYSSLAAYDLDKALALAAHAIELDPSSAQAYAMRADAHRRLGHFEPAITDATRAIELDPNAAWAYGIRSRSSLGLGKRREAVDDITKAIALDPALLDLKEVLKAAVE